MILEYFQDITRAEGAEAVLFFSRDNTLLEYWKNPNFKSQIFNELGIQFAQLFGVLGQFREEFPEVSVLWEKGQIIAKSFPQFLMIAIGRSKLDPALVRLISNIAYAEAMESKKFQKALKSLKVKSYNFLDNEHLDEVEREYFARIMQYNSDT